MNRKFGMCARFNNCTVGIVKPHAMMEGMSIIFMTLSPIEALRPGRRVELDFICKIKSRKQWSLTLKGTLLLYRNLHTNFYYFRQRKKMTLMVLGE